MAKTILLPETTFTAEEFTYGFKHEIRDLLINAESITVVFDGVKYENVLRRSNNGNEYGAEFGGQSFDFTKYPFFINSQEEEDGGLN